MRLLPNNGTIAIVAPAGAIAPEILSKAVEIIEQKGYTVRIMPHVLNCATGVFSATDEQRVSDMQRALNDDSIDAIICSRGGYGSCRIIDKLDFSHFKNNPKWIVGFSDITVLHAKLTSIGIASVHAPMLKHIATHGLEHNDNKILFEILAGKTEFQTQLESHALNRFGVAEGTLIGGNLSILHSLRGTKLDIQPQNKILFIEDLSEYNYHIDRMMQNLKLGNILSQLNGIIVGQFTNIKDGNTPFGKNAYEIVAETVKDYDYTTIFGYPAGHNNDINMPLILGKRVRIEANKETSTINYLQ